MKYWACLVIVFGVLTFCSCAKSAPVADKTTSEIPNEKSPTVTASVTQNSQSTSITTAPAASAPAIGTFSGTGVGDGSVLYEGYFYIASEMPEGNGLIHVLKVKASDFSNYLDYVDTNVTIGGRSILVAGGYLWTVEEQGGTGSKLYRRSLTTLVSDANYTPLSANPPGFQYISAIVSDDTFIYCFGQMSLGLYFSKIKISDGSITTHTANGAGYSSLGWVHAAAIDTTGGYIYCSGVLADATGTIFKVQISDMAIAAQVNIDAYCHDDALQDANYVYFQGYESGLSGGKLRRFDKSDLSENNISLGDRTLDGFCFLNGTDGDVLTVNSGGTKKAYLVKSDLSTVLATTPVTTSETGINEVISDGTYVYLMGYGGSGATEYVRFYKYKMSDFTGSTTESSSILPE